MLRVARRVREPRKALQVVCSGGGCRKREQMTWVIIYQPTGSDVCEHGTQTSVAKGLGLDQLEERTLWSKLVIGLYRKR